tara:strand:- start:2736 stop:3050 length:315 start_codon:yes stop_codon:yes gene_type:complete
MVNTNFSKETARQLLQEKLNQIDLLKKDMADLLHILQRMVDFVENPVHSEDDSAPEYLTDGQMLDIITEQIKKQIKQRKHEYKTCDNCSYDILDDEGNIMEHYC